MAQSWWRAHVTLRRRGNDLNGGRCRLLYRRIRAAWPRIWDRLWKKHEAMAVQISGATGAAINASATRNIGQLNVLGRTVLTASSPVGAARSESAMNT
jgi:hypothetical protein